MVGVGLVSLPFAGRCQPQSPSQASGPAPEPPVSQATPPPPAEATRAEGNQADVPSLEELAKAPVQLLSTNQPVPAKIRLSAPSAELVKLASSGVDQGVMLAYVTNSASTFNLTADEIIYLNDMGVPGPVVTAMIQRDQALKAAGVVALNAQAPVVTNLPAPGDVAPQVETAPLTPPESQVETAPPVAEVTDPVFYDSLAPYGSWVYVSGYGRCWQPSVVRINPGWQPYFHGGHWVYSDCGWYWRSDYTWGWAPFHYGRWFHHNSVGWCWAPGAVWGPSWVAWRYSSDYCGWAPLPPGAYFGFGVGLTFHGRHVNNWNDCGLGASHYRFVAWRDFDHHRVGEHGLPPHQGAQVYRNTVVANNITAHNNTVVNQGISRDRVAAATRHDIRPVAIRDASTAGQTGSGRADHLAGNTLTVYRPAITHPPTTRPAPTVGPQPRPLASNGGTQGGPTSTASAPPAPSAQPAGHTTAIPPRPTPVAGPQNRPVTPLTRGQGPSTAGNASIAPNTTPTQGLVPGGTQRPPTVTLPTTPTRQVPQTPNPAPTTPRPAQPSGALVWRGSNPTTQSERPQAPAQAVGTPRPNYPPAYQQATRPAAEVPRNPPAPYYSGPQRQSSPSPTYYAPPPAPSRPAPSYSPPPSYSRPSQGPAQPAPSYSAPPRPSTPAASAPPAPAAAPGPAPSNPSKGDNNNNSRSQR
jgi:hypothetical protein